MTASQDARNYLARERGEPESPSVASRTHDRYPICELATCGRPIFPSDMEVGGMHERCCELSRERGQ